MRDFKYEAVKPKTRNELINELESDDPRTVANALYAASRYEKDWKWVQDLCVRFLDSANVEVRWAAATCLGDLAFSRHPLDVLVVEPALERAIKDPTIADPARFSLSMVKQFLGS